jgi:hypothetical protein
MARFRSSLMRVTNLATGKVYYYIEKCGTMQRVGLDEYHNRTMMFLTPDGTYENVSTVTTKTHRRDYATVVWTEQLKGETK